MKLLIGTKNSGKIAIYSEILNKLGIEWISLRDLNIDTDVEETGSTTLENAILKAEAYYREAKIPVLVNDSGLIIDKLTPEDQPGVLVRRFGGKEMTDEEVIEVFSHKIKEVGGASDAHFVVSLAIVDENGQIYSKDFISPRYFIDKPSTMIVKGLPLRSLDYSTKDKKYLSEMTIEEANAYEGDCILDQTKFIKEVLQKL
jgi:XTP/dITP diphosphohydrolase